MKKVFKIEILLGMLFGIPLFYMTYDAGFKCGDLQSVKDRISVLNVQIDSLDRLLSRQRIESFPDHSRIPDDNLTP